MNIKERNSIKDIKRAGGDFMVRLYRRALEKLNRHHGASMELIHKTVRQKVCLNQEEVYEKKTKILFMAENSFCFEILKYFSEIFSHLDY